MFSQAASRTDAWLTRRGWLRADAGSARIGLAETRTQDGSRFVVLEATPPHGQPVEMWFDASTFLLERTVRTMPISIQTVRYSDYRRVSGIALPYTIETSDSSAPTKDIVRVDQWEPRKHVPNATFAAPTPPDDTTLDGETTLPLDIDGFVMVAARLNGRDFDFILDTGGHNIITPEVAKLLDLHAVGEGTSGGSGSGTLTQQYVRIERLELGTATLRDQHFYVLPLQYDTVERGTQPPLAGILGLEIFERFAVRIDYPDARLTLRKLDRFHHATGGVPVPIMFDDDQPLLQGRIDGVSGLIGLDTGNGSTLVVQPVWARSNGLADTLKRGVETVSYGSGGASANWVSRVLSVEVGGVELRNQIVRYAEDRSGAFSSRTRGVVSASGAEAVEPRANSSPLQPNARRDVDRRDRIAQYPRLRDASHRDRPRRALEQRRQRLGDEAAARRVDVAVPGRGLLVRRRSAAAPGAAARPSPASSRRREGAAPPPPLRSSRCSCRRECSRRRRSGSAPTSTPAPWPSGWSTGSGSRRPGRGAPASSLVASGGSSASSVRKRSRDGYVDAICCSWTRSRWRTGASS